jgi:signal-transduction protein with cAMP-binding, CBS, and nucleotidyltransferase domain
MKQTAIDSYPKDKTKNMLNGIPFFNDLSINDPQQHQLLLHHSSIIELSGGDVLIRKGESDHVLYFLLKGELGIYTDESPGRKALPISRLSQGQVLGALTVITGLPRTATVALEKGAADALVLATDVSIFGAKEDFSKVTLRTKLAIYRMAINNTRFKLETYKSRDPKNPLAEVYAKLPKFAGAKDSMEELQFHAQQATTLARLLQKWNEIQ